MKAALACAACALCGCGRLGFDASTTDANSDVTIDDVLPDSPVTGCPAGTLFCDDFESGSTSRWSGNPNPMSTTRTVPTPVHLGVRAFNTIYASSSQMSGISTPLDLVAGESLAVQLWVRFPAAVQNGEGPMMLSVDDGYTHYVAPYCNEVSMWSVNEDSPGGGFADYESSTPCTVDTWQCIELVYERMPSPHAQLYVDNAPTIDMAMKDPAPDFHLFAIGAARSSTNGLETVIDDVTVTRQRLGCP